MLKVLRELDTIESAKAFFQQARERLLNVNGWHKLAGAPFANFHLADKNGYKVKG